MEKRAHVVWRGGLEFEEGSVEDVRLVLNGEPAGRAFKPAALLLTALAACTGMDAISILVKKRQQVERYVIDVTGRQRDEHPRTFRTIIVTHILEGPALDDRAVARAIELSARRYCVVGAHLAAGDTAITHRFHIRDRAGERTCDCLVIGPHGSGLSAADAVALTD